MKKSSLLYASLTIFVGSLIVFIVSATLASTPQAEIRSQAVDSMRGMPILLGQPGTPAVKSTPNVEVNRTLFPVRPDAQLTAPSVPAVSPAKESMNEGSLTKEQSGFNISARAPEGTPILKRQTTTPHERSAAEGSPSLTAGLSPSERAALQDQAKSDLSKSSGEGNRESAPPLRGRGPRSLDEILLTEEFEAGVPPSGWSLYRHNMGDPSYTWHTSFPGAGGGGSRADVLYADDLTLQDEWLVTPSLDLTTGSQTWYVRFWWMASYSWAVDPHDNYDLELRVSTDGGYTWQPNTLWNENYAGVFVNWQWYQAVVSLDAYRNETNVKLAWRYHGQDGAEAGLDDVEIATCEMSCQAGDSLEAAEDPSDTTFYRTDPDGGPNNETNGGVTHYGSMYSGGTVCGVGFTYTPPGGGYFRDTDWYMFTLTERDTVILTVEAEFPVQFGIVDTALSYFIAYDFGQPCEEKTVTVNCLDPGSYAVWVGPSVFSGLPVPLHYRASLRIAPCSGSGENCDSVKVIPSLPYSYSSTTVGHVNDFAPCFGLVNNAPDVIFLFHPLTTGFRNLSLCGSVYDTELEVRTDGACPGDTRIICVDDYCGLQSAARVMMNAGQTYYIVVDGYGNNSGAYTLDMSDTDCDYSCHPGDVLECAETTDTTHSYSDCNGGCNNASEVFTYGELQCGQTVCGSCFTYIGAGGSDWRDTDWYRFTLPERDSVRVVVTAEFPVQVYLFDTSCAFPVVLAEASGGACDTIVLRTDVCLPAGIYTLWIGPVSFTGIETPLSYRATLMCPLCPDSPPRPCPENALFGQSPATPFGPWNAGTSDAGSNFRRAENFAGIPYAITGIHFWGINATFSGSFITCVEDPKPFVVEFREDSSGWPGRIVRTYISALYGEPTGDLGFGTYPILAYSATFPEPILMSRGWVSIYGFVGPDCWFLWSSATGALEDSSALWINGVLSREYFPLALCLLGEEIPTPECDSAYTLFEQPVISRDSAWVAGISDSALSMNYERAESFTGLSEPIEQIEFWGVSLDAGDFSPCRQSPKPFAIRFYTDAGGLPGTAVCSTFVVLAATPTGHLYGFYPLYEYRATVPACTLSTGWISVKGSSAEDCAFYWMCNRATDGVSVIRSTGAWGVQSFDLSLCLGAPPAAVIAGNVRYHVSAEAVGGIKLDVIPGDSALTDGSGFYQLPGLPLDETYTVTPDSQSATDCGGSISFLDASLAARFALSQITLDSLNQRAADVSGNDTVSFYDASLIAQYAIGSLTEFPCLARWIFDPVSRTYDPLTANRAGESYSALCVGDVSGNWTPPVMTAPMVISSVLNDALSAADVLSAKNIVEQDAYSIQFDCIYDPTELQFANVEPAASAGWYFFTREEEGVVHIGGFGVTPIPSGQTIVRARFKSPGGSIGSSAVHVREYRVNDAAPVSGEIAVSSSSAPLEYALRQNYPNPFNAATVIQYSIPEQTTVRLAIYNTLGERVAVLVDAIQAADRYRVNFDASHLSSGVYFCRLDAGSFRKMQKMILLK